MTPQAFCYNAIFFTYALVLGSFFGVPCRERGTIPAAIRGRQLPRTGAAGAALRHSRPAGHDLRHLRHLRRSCCGTALLFAHGMIGVIGQTVAWSMVFFFASAAASSAYLTVGESFPIEIRALAIALFYAFGTGIGGVAGPWLFGELIGTGERFHILGATRSARPSCSARRRSSGAGAWLPSADRWRTSPRRCRGRTERMALGYQRPAGASGARTSSADSARGSD